MASPSRSSTSRPRRDHAGRFFIGTLILLGLVASVFLIFSNSVHMIRVGMVAALWAAAIGAMAATKYRKDAAVDKAKVRDLQTVYELQLEREITARREYELGVEARVREEVGADAAELAALRAELSVLRQSLQRLFDGDLPMDRPALRAEAMRVPELPGTAAAPANGSSANAGTGQAARNPLTPVFVPEHPAPPAFASPDDDPVTAETSVVPADDEPAPPDAPARLRPPTWPHPFETVRDREVGTWADAYAADDPASSDDDAAAGAATRPAGGSPASSGRSSAAGSDPTPAGGSKAATGANASAAAGSNPAAGSSTAAAGSSTAAARTGTSGKTSSAAGSATVSGANPAAPGSGAAPTGPGVAAGSGATGSGTAAGSGVATGPGRATGTDVPADPGVPAASSGAAGSGVAAASGATEPSAAVGSSTAVGATAAGADPSAAGPSAPVAGSGTAADSPTAGAHPSTVPAAAGAPPGSPDAPVPDEQQPSRTPAAETPSPRPTTPTIGTSSRRRRREEGGGSGDGQRRLSVAEIMANLASEQQQRP
ncbi:hypothetical protein SAMN05421776_107231 [Nocardia farcinica]|uniref:DUF6779 domain-containing protein n=1 Tax=Nocardia farcinica TaxID=37329 RepID=A0A0H5NY25_NOCFR|nr:DUF6779 domain-containing protein [Nocardia farcinica]CRY80387.1 Uncharacterised protein [Nocardia farcinica]SIT28363.1 hypothetical protein SAMN05421776_107231 [Nocardia farcinica]